MDFFIGITPPDEIKKRILTFEKKFSHNLVPEIFEPHITVKAQGGLAEDRGWITAVESVTRQSQFFQVAFDGVGRFDNAVVFLKPFPSEELVGLHRKLIEAIHPGDDLMRKKFEGKVYTPHLTLGNIKHGLSKEELDSMYELAKIDLSHVPGFTVEFLRIYLRKDLDGPYVKLMDVPLGN